MKPIFVTLIALAAAAAGWFASTRFTSSHAGGTSTGGGRRILYYQSAMHPWVKSDQPGRCTICGMELTPIYEGSAGFDLTGGPHTVALSRQMMQVLNVSTVTAKEQPLIRTLRVSGMIDDDATRHRILSASVKGRVDKLYVNYMGAEVTAGQPLAEFFSRELLAAIADYNFAGSAALRDAAANRLRQAGLTAEQIAALPQRDPKKLTEQILSPMTGTVVEKEVNEGQWVEAGAKLFAIADFSTMWFIFRAYEKDLPWIKPGLDVDVLTPSQPGHSFPGKISFIDPTLDEVTRTVKVRVELPNPLVDGRRQLLHRLYADAVVKLEAPAVLALPRSAVIQTGAQAVAYVDLGNGAYEHRDLHLGRRGDDMVEILSGVKTGEAVVTNGNLLIDGQSEINRAFAAPVPAPVVNKAAPALTETQKKALGEFVAVADAMAAALANDDLLAFVKAAEPVANVTEALTKSLAARPEVAGELAALEKAKSLHGFEDLAAARKAFHAFTLAATGVVQPLRAEGSGAPEFQVWECSMVDEAIPGAPKKGRWVQTGGRAGHNPFFGKAMLDCAVSIKSD